MEHQSWEELLQNVGPCTTQQATSFPQRLTKHWELLQDPPKIDLPSIAKYYLTSEEPSILIFFF